MDENLREAVNLNRNEFLASIFSSLATVGIAGFAVASSLASRAIWDHVFPSKSMHSLATVTLLIILCVGFDFLFRMLRTHVSETVSQAYELRLTRYLYSRLMRVRVGNGLSSSMASMIFQQVDALRDGAGVWLTVSVECLTIALVLAVMAGLSLLCAMITLIGFLIIIGFALLVQGAINRAMQANTKEQEDRQLLLTESILGREDILACGAVSAVTERMERATESVAKSNKRLRDISSFGLTAIGSMQSLLRCVITVALALDIISGANTVGSLIAVQILLLGIIMTPIGTLSGAAIRLGRAKSSMRTILKLEDMKMSNRGGYKPIGKIQIGVEFDNVSVNYGLPTSAVDGVSFSVAENEVVALCGRPGAGKSTMGKLASGLLMPTSGTVKINGVSTAGWDFDNLTKWVCYNGQDSKLFTGTLRDNILLGNPGATEAEMCEVLRVIGAWSWVSSHPMGLMMSISEGGSNLSGGQRRMVGLTRALVSRAGILVLDEPTAHMDVETVRFMIANINGVLRDRTVIIITHNPELLVLCNRAVFLANGKISAIKNIVVKGE